VLIGKLDFTGTTICGIIIEKANEKIK